MSKKVLVTGGCGFIGSHFVNLLLGNKFHVTNLDALTYAGTKRSEHPNHHFIHGDITDPYIVEEAVKGVSTIFNFAAESHVDRSIVDSTPFVRTNVLGTQVLLDAAKRHNLKYVQVSTDEVYGTINTGSFNEESPLAPNNPYAASKASADLLVRSYVKTYRLDAIITRCSNNYGTHQYPEKLIPLFITNLLQDKPVPVYGNGLSIRDWIHVQDHCQGIFIAWKKGQIGEIYNFGGRTEKNALEIARILVRKLNKSESLINFVQDRPGNDQRYSIDCTKAEKLGWKRVWPFARGLEHTIEWYKTQAALQAHQMQVSTPPALVAL
jgi:dTDP-glucose 4,6-dehydratase